MVQNMETYHEGSYRCSRVGHADRCPDAPRERGPNVPGEFLNYEELIADAGEVADAEMWEVFNMGCGMCAIVPNERGGDAMALLDRHHPGAAVIGQVTDSDGEVALPTAGLKLARQRSD